MQPVCSLTGMADNFVCVEPVGSLPDLTCSFKGVQSMCSLPSTSVSPLPTYFTSDQLPMQRP
eukprot:6954641-Prorocentrum_lima.AAC.1